MYPCFIAIQVYQKWTSKLMDEGIVAGVLLIQSVNIYMLQSMSQVDTFVIPLSPIYTYLI